MTSDLQSTLSSCQMLNYCVTWNKLTFELRMASCSMGLVYRALLEAEPKLKIKKKKLHVMDVSGYDDICCKQMYC